MLTKNQLKFIHSLQLKKNRLESAAFVVEGGKSVLELLTSDFDIELVAVTSEFYKENRKAFDNQAHPIEIATAAELEKAGSLQSNNAALAVAKTKPNLELVAEAGEFVVVLDDIRDPGNLGTIIRVADWYGIRKLICSETTTDFYNPKVIAASKGSFTRVKPYYCFLPDFFGKYPNSTIYGAFLDGQDVHRTDFAREGYLVMGNESNGITSQTESFVNQRITIPGYGQAESLNVGIATAIILDNWRRAMQ